MKKRSLLPVLCTLPAVTGLVCAALLLLCLRQPEPPDPLGPFTGWELLESACRALPGVVFTALLVCFLLLMAHRRLNFSAAALWAAGALAPVSYTHLDVYKRQIVPRRPARAQPPTHFLVQRKT